MGNDFLFTHTRFPYKKRDEVVPGKIKKAMNEFRKWRYDYTVLFHSYCDLIGATANSFTLWQDVMFKKGVPVISGVAVDETLLEKYVWAIRSVPADQLISLLFYADAKNRSAFEVGYLVPKILERNPQDTYVINPSPFVIHDTVGKCGGYLVCDHYYSDVYTKQYPGEQFLQYSDAALLKKGKRILAQVIMRWQKKTGWMRD